LAQIDVWVIPRFTLKKKLIFTEANEDNEGGNEEEKAGEFGAPSSSSGLRYLRLLL